jgi:hypothetical protein
MDDRRFPVDPDTREHLMTAAALLPVAAVAIVVGVLVAEQSRLVLVLAFVPLFWLLLTSALTRLLVVSFGALLTFQNTSDVSALKAVYLLCFIVSLTGALLSLSRDGSTAPGRPTRRIAVAGGVILLLVGLSFVPALLYETPLIDWLRDGFSYLFFGGSVLLAIDYARHIPTRTLTAVFVSCGVLATASFFLSWIHRRGIGELGVTELGFSSFLLSIALIAFAVAKTQWPGSHRFQWSVIAALAMLALLATATRSSLVALVAVIVVLTLAPTSLRARALGASVLVTVTIGVGFLALRGGIASDLIDVEKTRARIATVTSAVEDPSSDVSLRGRRLQTHAAMETFESAPIMGVGPGHPISGSGYSGTEDGYFVDSPAGFLAKFGAIGLIGLIAFLWLLAQFLAEAKARTTPAGLALIAFLVTGIAWSVLGTPFDDKGTGLALGLLLALTIQETRILKTHRPDVPVTSTHNAPSAI